MAGKPPDYNVSAVMRGTDVKGNIGVAWKSDNDDGRISMKLHGFVTLTGHPDLYITLFPRDDGPRDDGAPGPKTRPGSRTRPARGQDTDDDIPF